jgi:hypothetical protein
MIEVPVGENVGMFEKLKNPQYGQIQGIRKGDTGEMSHK